jgi:hypothetical protein
MKSHYKLFAFLLLFFAVSANAQQLTTPMIFKVDAPVNIAGNYDYGYPTDWGPTTLPATVTGQAAWGYNAAGDSLGCTPLTTNLTGKIAVLRRGACSFSLKAYHAQQAGAVGTLLLNHTYNAAGGGIVNMLGGDSASAVTTPTVFLTRDDGDIILAELDNGTPVTLSFYVPKIDDAFAILHHKTPISQIIDLDNFSVVVFNNSVNAETNVMGIVEVTDPNGVVTTLTETVGTLNENTIDTIEFSNSYSPVDSGYYQIKFKVTSDAGTYAGDSIMQSFHITDYTWGNDGDEVVGGVTPSNFATTFRYDIGNTYFVGDNPAVVTHTSFAFETPDSLIGETFDIILYDMDANLDGQIDGGTSADYTTFTTVAFASYTVPAGLSSNDTVVVELNPLNGDDITLNANGTYLITVQYDALTSPTGNTFAPDYTFTSPVSYEFVNTMVYTTQLYTGGFSGGWNALLRLHLDGFVQEDVATEEIATLDNAKINVFPNPTTEFITVDLELENVSEIVDVKIIDVNGRVLQDKIFNNIKNDKLTFDVKNLAAGNYFVRVQTEEGTRTKHFTVAK